VAGKALLITSCRLPPTEMAIWLSAEFESRCTIPRVCRARKANYYLWQYNAPGRFLASTATFCADRVALLLTPWSTNGTQGWFCQLVSVKLSRRCGRCCRALMQRTPDPSMQGQIVHLSPELGDQQQPKINLWKPRWTTSRREIWSLFAAASEIAPFRVPLPLFCPGDGTPSLDRNEASHSADPILRLSHIRAAHQHCRRL